MHIRTDRLGFFNARLEQRMAQAGVSARQLAPRVQTSYEHIRKLLSGCCLPSKTLAKRLCVELQLDAKDVEERIEKDRCLFKYGDVMWEIWGLNPKGAHLYILAPMMSEKQWRLFCQIGDMLAGKTQPKKNSKTEGRSSVADK